MTSWLSRQILMAVLIHCVVCPIELVADDCCPVQVDDVIFCVIVSVNLSPYLLYIFALLVILLQEKCNVFCRRHFAE